MTENCCLRPYSTVDCTNGVTWGLNETLTCYTKSRCQKCVLAVGFSSGGCVRCCAASRESCSEEENGSTLSIWAILVLATIGSCFIFTLLYVLTSRRRNSNAPYRAFAPHSYFVALPIATVDVDKTVTDMKGSNRESNEQDEDDESISASIVLLSESGAEDNTAVPVARRTVPPVVGVRRPQAHSRNHPNMFYLDVNSASST